jgi:hypothetical protein
MAVVAVIVVAAAGYWWLNRPSGNTAPRPADPTSATEGATSPPQDRSDLSNKAIGAILEQSWNFYVRAEIFLGATYFGNTTSFGRNAGSLHALALISDYPTYRALATKGLIKLEELSLAEAPPATRAARLQRAATVSLTQERAKLGSVDNKKNTVTFVFGTYRVEKIVSNTSIDTKEGNYRFVEGTHVLEPQQEFSDLWAELGWPSYRERRFRVVFKYDTTRSQWGVAVASNGRFTAEDVGPRNGDFESSNVPPTLDQLRLSPR